MLREATERYKTKQAEADEAREAVIQAVVEALEAGERPKDVAENSPFKEVWVRRLARERGISPRPAGRRQPRTDDTD